MAISVEQTQTIREAMMENRVGSGEWVGTVEHAYWQFFYENPQQCNPTDINTLAKWEFMKRISFDLFRQMQSARKSGLPFTKIGHWIK